MKYQKFTSVWDAIEDDPQERASLKARSKLMSAIDAHIKAQGWTQAQAAKAFGVTQPRISDLKRGKIDLFSVDMLVSMLGKAGLEVEINIKTEKAA